MNRHQSTKILVRMIETIEAEQTPAEVRELYVFGSYARGAMEPDDVDIVVIHGEPPPELMKALQAKVDENARTFFEQLTGAEKRFQAAMRRAFRKPGERVDLIVGRNLDEIVRMYRFDHSDLILLWSKADREWQANLQESNRIRWRELCLGISSFRRNGRVAVRRKSRRLRESWTARN